MPQFIYPPPPYFSLLSMVALSGYEIISKIYESINSVVYSARRCQDKQLVILKVLKEEYPTPEELIRYKQEYKIVRSLKLEGVIKAYSLEQLQNTLTITFEDFGGESLDKLIKYRQFTIKEKLSVAIKITESLARIHAANIIHKDINPSNIVFNPQTEQLKIIDFGISTVLSTENTPLGNPNILEGTLAYISPEQTGRMNRALDYRTDFYSLGVTLYELLTHKLPFETSDAMELVHCHIAKQPLPPYELDPKIPQAVSNIVMKLLAKTAEERYKSGWGLLSDLVNCLTGLENNSLIKDFTPGKNDVSDKFQIPQKLYGREQEIATLIAAMERVTQGRNEVVMTVGYSGIGKTALVQEIYKPITQQRGYFIKGKFEQYQRHVPYFALIKAFQGLVRQILTESEPELALWREKLLDIFGSNGQVVIDVIPEIEFIIGEQPAVPELGPLEAQNRLRFIFQNFLKILAKPEHPLVIFLDDLQWADTASLQLMQSLILPLESPDSLVVSQVEKLALSQERKKYSTVLTPPAPRSEGGLLFIGAYRDNEVSLAHPLMLALEEIQKYGINVNYIYLSNLRLDNISKIISDTINYSEDETKALAELVLTKTSGNPFFINEFLKLLYADKLLVFDVEQGIWQWDLLKIQAQRMTDNVVELLSSKIQKLSNDTQQVLQLAACIGSQFDLSTLASSIAKTPKETITLLHEAIALGMVMPLSKEYKSIELDIPTTVNELIQARGVGVRYWDASQKIEYKFSHDRIQQAAYDLIPQEVKQVVHKQVGQLLLHSTPVNEREKKIFAIVNQLNFGIPLINTQSERDELARLNLTAGKKAIATAAYEPAFRYLMVGVNLLDEQSWLRGYDLTLELFVEAAKAAYLSADFEQMEKLAQTVVQKANTLLDKVKVYEVKILACVAQSQPLEAVKTALQVLKLLEIDFPEKPSKFTILLALLNTKLCLTGKQAEDLISLPQMTKPEKLAAMRIMGIAGSPVYNSAPELMPLLALKGVNLSIKYGNASMSAYGYASYGVILCGALGDIEQGYRFGEIALSLLEKFNAKELKARTYMVFNNFIRHWKEHLKEGLQPLLEAYSVGLETGDLEFAAYSIYIYFYHSYFLGKELGLLERQMADYIRAIGQYKQEATLHLFKMYRQIVLNLRSVAGNPCYLSGESYDQKTMLPLARAGNHRTAIFDLYFNQLILCYLFENYQQAIKNAAIAEKYLDGARGSPSVPIFYFYSSLAELAVYTSTPYLKQRYLLRKVARQQRKMKQWIQHTQANHLHKYYLVKAEQHRVRGQVVKAMVDYDRAIALAKKYEYLNEEALCHELAAKFYLNTGRVTVAQAYMHNARYCYLLWGANRKVKELEEKYPHLLAQVSDFKGKDLNINTTVSQTDKSSILLDLNTVIKASQAISSEIVLQEVIDKLMRIVMESAGAETIFLILITSEKMIIKSAISVKDNYIIQSPIAVEENKNLPISVINYVKRTKESLVLDNIDSNSIFANDPYIQLHKPNSILCAPLLNQNELIGLVYLENNLVSGAFTSERIEVVKLLCSQAAISLKNAQLYQNLQQSEAKEREKAQQLKQSLQELQQAQEKLMQAQEKLLHDAFHDSLTGLPNRAYFINRLEHAIQLALRHQDYLYAVLFIDLDRFKVINDSLGHLVGDELIKSVATSLQNSLRATDTIARLGGDEFVVLLEKIKDLKEVTSVAERIQEQLRLPHQLNDYEVFTEASIGITLSTMSYQRAIDVLRDADAAMYHAKESAKGSYKIFDPIMQTRAYERLQLETDLRRAIELHEFCVYYQPIVDLSSSCLSGFEALVRWHHPLKGWISPAEFIPVAEETGLINALGWWVLQQACHQLHTWQQQFAQHNSLTINVNLSVQQLKQADLIKRIEQILQVTQISGSCLKLEITESCILATADLETRTLEQLKALGIRLCIDDFGTGYSSLSRLYYLPIDTLKIDRSFVSRLESSSSNNEIVQTIITLAHSLGIDAVAEGIETPKQLEKLQELGCDLGQGYLFSEPVDGQMATQMLQLKRQMNEE